MTRYGDYQIDTELYGKGFTWAYRHPPSGWVHQPLTRLNGTARLLPYPTREEAIEAAKKEIDKIKYKDL